MNDVEGRFRDLPPPQHPDEIEAAGAKPASERQVYVMRIRAEPGVDEKQALRAVLKAMFRRWGLKCLSIVPEKPEG